MRISLSGREEVGAVALLEGLQRLCSQKDWMTRPRPERWAWSPARVIPI